MSIMEFVGGGISIIGTVFLVWFAWLWIIFGYKVAKGRRLTVQYYRRTRLQVGLLSFISFFFMGLGWLIISEDIDVQLNNLGTILLGPICFSSFLAGVMIFGFISSSQGSWSYLVYL